MYRNIFRTFVSRIIAAVLTFGVVFVSSRSLGPEKYGTIGLIMVAVGMALLFSALIGGTSLVYYTSRVKPAALFTVSSLWGLLTSLVISGLMGVLKLYPPEFFLFVFLISLLANISQNLMFIILGKERIYQQNIITVMQVFTHFCIVIFLFHGLKAPSVGHYLLSVLISHTVATLAGLFFCRKEVFPLTFSGISASISEIMQYGFWVQLSAFIQLFNYRLSYYMVDWFLGRQMLGIYTLAVQLAESFWILPRSVAIVQFAHISNISEPKDSVVLSYKLMQTVMLSIAVFSIPIFFIPEDWLILVFGPGYAGIKNVLILLIPAIVIFSGAIILSHYFSGIGKVKFNAMTGGIGLIVTTGACFAFIPAFGLKGAAYAANISYAVMYITSLIIFILVSRSSLRELSKQNISMKKLWQQIRSFGEKE